MQIKPIQPMHQQITTADISVDKIIMTCFINLLLQNIPASLVKGSLSASIMTVVYTRYKSLVLEP